MFLTNIDQPLSTRLKTAREQLSATLNAGELDLLPDDTRLIIRGLELFLLEAGEETFVLENTHRIKQRTFR